jgi:hypothetical protein
MMNYVEMIKNYHLPYIFPDEYKILSDESKKSYDEITKFGSFLPLEQKWINKLKYWINNRKVLEIMSGTGLLARFLGDNVLATDIGQSKIFNYNNLHTKNFKYGESVEIVKKYGHKADILLVSWPPNGSFVTKSCNIWGTKKSIIYIGGNVGCCADEEFFQRFKKDKHQPITIPQWFNSSIELVIGKWR